MTIRLRPHHLLCLLTYLGKGYTPAFIANYDRIVERLNNGEDIELVWGPDDICQPMLGEQACHCHNASVHERDEAAARDVGVLLSGEALMPGPMTLAPGTIATLRDQFSKGAIRAACRGCEWQDLCTSIADRGFEDCKLAPTSR